MIQRHCLLFALFLFSFQSYSQIKTPEKKPFNVGVFTGIGGMNYTPIPGLDIHYKGTLLRFAPGYRVNSIGIIREIMPLSRVFYNWYWIASVYGSRGEKDNLFGAGRYTTITSDFNRFVFLTGAKAYFSNRWYTQLQAGFLYTKYITKGFPSDKEYSPYFEFSLGINLFKNFINEEDFE